MLDIAQSCTGQNSRFYKLQEEELIFCEGRPIEGRGLTDRELQKNNFYRIFKQAQAHENV